MRIFYQSYDGHIFAVRIISMRLVIVTNEYGLSTRITNQAANAGENAWQYTCRLLGGDFKPIKDLHMPPLVQESRKALADELRAMRINSHYGIDGRSTPLNLSMSSKKDT